MCRFQGVGFRVQGVSPRGGVRPTPPVFRGRKGHSLHARAWWSVRVEGSVFSVQYSGFRLEVLVCGLKVEGSEF